ncbi:MAG: YihY/virulence factor BrkB family protein [Muribaculaceae bacterium]|nr:YihY/virulence factor BrkB family protein [Muribaculaceae bacterium]
MKHSLSTTIKRLYTKALSLWEYASDGVWHDSRNTWWVKIIKTLNLSVRSFTNADVQTQACAMTYRVLLALVPALALFFAIGRGFGLQNVIQQELYDYFPNQHQAIDTGLRFVDSYLNNSSEGIFVGVGLVFLLWTLISLLSSVEDTFNKIWSVPRGRSIWRKLSDYTAMLLILPILMICSGGLSAMISNTLMSIFHFKWLTPMVSVIMELASWLFTWLFFAAAYVLIPNTRVKFSNAFIAGVIAGSGFLILQWVFVSGQMMVAKYNAIYGSFSFLPLMLLWLQLTWVICLAGAVICYSSQNIFQFSFTSEVERISPEYRFKTTLALATLIVKRFSEQKPPLTSHQIIQKYGLPSRLVSEELVQLVNTGLIIPVVKDRTDMDLAYQPAIPTSDITVAEVYQRLMNLGNHNFVPDFDQKFPGPTEETEKLMSAAIASGNTLLENLQINEIKDTFKTNPYTNTK